MPAFPYLIPVDAAPRWANADQTRIDIDVVFPHLGTDPVRYTAAQTDPGWPHSEEIFSRAAAGEFGTVSPYQSPPVVLAPLTQRQFRLGLKAGGISIAAVTAAIDAIEDADARETAQIEWQFASEFRRDHPLIQTIGAAVGLTSGEIDELWTAALGL